MKEIRISDQLSLPLDFVTERIAFLARTGAGKSGGMRVLAEQMFEAGQFFVFLDPKGDAWGIRSDYSVLIMGGEHGDVPLDPRSGSFVADFLVRDRISTVLDVSEFSEADMVRFVADFGDRFYRTNRAAAHWFIDEADEFAPQSGYTKEATKCLGAIQRIQRRGRGRGIGVTLASQRSAVINKSVLTQAGTLIVMQTTAPHDQRAVDDWLQYAATKDARNLIMAALPSLKEREAFVYSPQFLGLEPVRIKFAKFNSFDSMRTPKHGEAQQRPKRLADIDLSTIEKEMATTIERAKADDPKELRKQIADLQKQLRARAPVELKPVETIREVEKLIVKDAQIKRLEVFGEKLSSVGSQMVEVAKEISAALARVSVNGHKPTARVAVPTTRPASVAQPSRRTPRDGQGVSVSGSQQKIINSLAWLEQGVGLSPVVKKQVALMAGQSPTSGGFFNNLGALRSAGLIEYPSPGSVALTDAGRNAVDDNADVPTSSEQLQQQVIAMVSGSQAAILRELIDIYPDAIAKGDLAQRVGQSPTSGGYFNNLGRLRSLGMIDYPQSGYAVAADVLFKAG